MSFCGSPTDESVPIDVDFLGLEIDIGVGRCSTETILNADAVTFSLKGYGSTEMYSVWELAQFDPPTLAPFDVFGLRLGEIFWAERYMDPEKHLFMHILLSPLSSFGNDAFVDSNEGAWQNPSGTGLTKAQIRDNTGVGGELGLKPGGGTFGFTGFKKTTGSPQQATANSVMLAGKIIDEGTVGAPYPNWMTLRRGDYYKDTVYDWNIMGEAVIGVHHGVTYTRTGYTGYYEAGGTLDFNTFATRTIGKSSPTRPIRFQVATADSPTYDCDSDGLPDTYLLSYVNGHYSRTVYFPDSTVSSMGASGAGSPTTSQPRNKHWIIGDLRIGFLEERLPSMTWIGTSFVILDIDTATAGTQTCTNGGSWVINDISLEYNKVVLPGDRSLVQEVSAASEDYIIPDLDYGATGTGGVAITNTLRGDPISTSGTRSMQIATPSPGTLGDPWSNQGTDLTRACGTNPATSWWR
jgi:hypothetical protein